MKSGFDWKPFLAEGEVVLWEGRPARLKIFVLSAVIAGVAAAGWMLALEEVAQAPGGSECFTDDCPRADRKAGFVAYFAAPVSFLLGSGLMMLSLFIRNASAITSRRVLSTTRLIPGRRPKFEQIPVKGATPALNWFNVFVFSPDPAVADHKRRIVLWGKSKAEMKRGIAIIEELSSGDPLAQGRTP